MALTIVPCATSLASDFLNVNRWQPKVNILTNEMYLSTVFLVCGVATTLVVVYDWKGKLLSAVFSGGSTLSYTT
jgi:hypothetical protein